MIKSAAEALKEAAAKGAPLESMKGVHFGCKNMLYRPKEEQCYLFQEPPLLYGPSSAPASFLEVEAAAAGAGEPAPAPKPKVKPPSIANLENGVLKGDKIRSWKPFEVKETYKTGYLWRSTNWYAEGESIHIFPMKIYLVLATMFVIQLLLVLYVFP